MEWIGDAGPEPIPPGLLDRVMYIGTPTTLADGSRRPIEVDGPQAHLAIQGAATEPLPAHFHGVEQFQLFVSGSGTVGHHTVSAGIVHYTDRNTVYGPLRPGPAGMAYATLRPLHDPGASFMPGARAELAERLRTSTRRPEDRRNVTVRLDPPEGEGWVDLVNDTDGLCVAVTAVAPGAVAPDRTVEGAGAYTAVISGRVDDRGPGAVAWCPAGTGVQAAGGAGGAVLALLQFPVV